MDAENLVLDTLALTNQPVPRDVDKFERYVTELKRVSDDVLRFNADTEREPWTRIHVELVHSGIWADLTPCSRAVYVTLCALADRRKRVTIAGVETVAELSGLSVSRVLFAYRELKDYGLIWRRRIKLGDKQPYVTGLTGPRRWRA